MPTATKRWRVAPLCPSNHRARFPHLHGLLVQILFNRGVTDPLEVDAFLNGTIRYDDPFGLRGMAEAVERIRTAVRERQSIAVYGDFDADGVTATALLVETLRAFGVRVSPYIPHRVDEGYGLNCEALEKKIKPWGADLVITVDCGIRSAHEVAYARQLGLDMIVTDHHDPGSEPPAALAVINPKQDGCGYRFKGLAGVGLAYKLAQALLFEERRSPVAARPVEFHLDDVIDLVALGTVADIAPLLGENRVLVQRGLAQLRQPRRPGVLAMLNEAGMAPERVDATAIGFVLGPRLNAAGRLESAGLSYKVLTLPHLAEASDAAARLGELNRQRQRETLALVARVKQEIAAAGNSRYLYLSAGPDYRRGIVGLAAGRLSEELYRPVLVAERTETTVHGSARSIPEFNITAALDTIHEDDRSLLVRYGGHAMAAGFTAYSARLPELQARLEALAEAELAGRDLQPVLDIDAEVRLDDLDFAVQELLTQLEPCGHANAQPVLCTRGLIVQSRRLVGQDGQHLKLSVCDPQAKGPARYQTWDAIAFRQGDWFAAMPGRVDLAYTLEAQVYGGERRLQLNVKDIKASEGGG